MIKQTTETRPIYPPIIDNTIGAFVKDQPMEVDFYFQSGNEEIRWDWVIAHIDVGGQSFERLCRCYRANPLVKAAIRYDTLYKIVLYPSDFPADFVASTTAFKINTAYNISLKALRRSNTIATLINEKADISRFNKEAAGDMSQAGDSVIKYAIDIPKFTLWGGLTADQIETKYIVTAGNKLYENYLIPDIDSAKGPKEFHITTDAYRIKGELSFEGDKTDPIKENDILLWYQIKCYSDIVKEDGSKGQQEIPELSSDREYINRTWDLTSRSFAYTFDYDFTRFLDSNIATFNFVILYATRKGYLVSKTYPFKIAQETEGQISSVVKTDSNIVFMSKSQKETEVPLLIAEPNSYKGTVTLTTCIFSWYKNISKQGYLVFQRTEAGKENLSWETFAREPFIVDPGQNHIQYDDLTIEAGRPWLYRIQFYFEEAEGQDWVLTYANNSAETPRDEAVILLTEDIFLVTKDVILKVRYNPEVANYKRNIMDITSPTLGGIYPFIRRNGAQRYRTFNINGLISYQQEIEDTQNHTALLAHDSLDRTISIENDAQEAYILQTFGTDYNHMVTVKEDKIDIENSALKLLNYYDNEFEYDEFNSSLFINIKNKTDINSALYNRLTAYDRQRVYEKLYREKVMDFLYDDQIILFKSMQEGNIFIRLTNVSFTPDKKLNRNIYNFSAQAIEVLAPTSDNYEQLFSTITKNSYSVQRETIYTEGFKDTSTAIVSSGDIIIEKEDRSYTLAQNGNAIVEYKILEEDGWTDKISNEYTYLDLIGRKVTPLEKGGIFLFEAGHYPEMRIIKVKDEIKTETSYPAALKIYNVTYEFD